MHRLVSFAMALTLPLAFAACAGKPESSFANTGPVFDPMTYFAGRTQSWGVFENRSGAPTKIIQTFTAGKKSPDGLRFEQDLVFENGKKSHRTWNIRKLDEHHFTATGTGIVGTAKGTAFGSTFHLEFTLDAIAGNPLGRVHMSQWMYLQDDGVTLINRATATKLGVALAQITERFLKQR